MTHSVLIFNEVYEVNTHQRSNTIWVAVGNYNEKSITVRGRSVSEAIKRWKEATEYIKN